ncbi:MAG: hypothetical protein ABWK01_08295 [Infirmifilum sp.]
MYEGSFNVDISTPFSVKEVPIEAAKAKISFGVSVPVISNGTSRRKTWGSTSVPSFLSSDIEGAVKVIIRMKNSTISLGFELNKPMR